MGGLFSKPGNKEVATQCDGGSHRTALMTSSPSQISANRTPPISLGGLDALNSTTITEGIVYSAIQRCFRDPDLIRQLGDAVSKSSSSSIKSNHRQQKHHAISYNLTGEGHAIDESCEALDLIGLPDGSDSTIKVGKPLSKSQSENRIIDNNKTPAKSNPISLKKTIFSASGATFQDRSTERQRLLKNEGNFTIGSQDDEDAKTMALIRSKTRLKCNSVLQRQRHLDSEMSRLRRQCLSQEIQQSLRRGSATGKQSTTPTSILAAAKRQNSFTSAADQQLDDDLTMALGLHEEPPPKTARALLRKVTNCLGDMKEAIFLISDGLEAIDDLLSECCDETKITAAVTPPAVTPAKAFPPPVVQCRSVPVAAKTQCHAQRIFRNKENDGKYRRTSSSFSVATDKRNDSSGIWQI